MYTHYGRCAMARRNTHKGTSCHFTCSTSSYSRHWVLARGLCHSQTNLWFVFFSHISLFFFLESDWKRCSYLSFMCVWVGVGQTSERVGIVQRVQAKERTCTVRWTDDNSIETVSVYSIAIHSTFDFRLGDIVLRLPSTTSSSQEKSPSSSSSWVGEIIGIHDGKLTVCWYSLSSHEKNHSQNTQITTQNHCLPQQQKISTVDPANVFVLHRYSQLLSLSSFHWLVFCFFVPNTSCESIFVRNEWHWHSVMKWF